jgi:hypothetical protein
MTKHWKFTVKSLRGTMFPLDMLRYDCAFPRTSEAVSKIEQNLSGRLEDRISIEPFELQLRSDVKPPTLARWQSFGWLVTELDEVNDSTGRVKHLIPV